MGQIINARPALRVGVVDFDDRDPAAAVLNMIRAWLRPEDTVEVVKHAAIAPGLACDVAFVLNPCGETPLSAQLAAASIPVMALHEYGGFHPYQSVLYRGIEAAGGVHLPANDPDQIATSLTACRARRALAQSRLLVVDPQDNAHRAEVLRRFAVGCRARLGTEIVILSTDELKERAAACSPAAAADCLARLEAEVFTDAGEVSREHLLEVARLYLAERELLAEHDAVGISPHDIKGFLLVDRKRAMPNVSYGALVFDGYLAAEEADAGVLASELLLYVAFDRHPTMSNLYFTYGDRMTAAGSDKAYTHEQELADCRACFTENRVTLSHFSAAGVLPPNMMEEDRYTVRETLPCWPGQSMVLATPKLGPMVLARLGANADVLHTVYGEAFGRGPGDQFGWSRGRWFVRLPDVTDFAAKLQHHHYAIGQDPGDHAVYETLVDRLLGLQRL